MRYILLFLAALGCGILIGQNAGNLVTYRVDKIADDSIYLIERTITGGVRPDTIIRNSLFNDTIALKRHVLRARQIAKDKKAKFQAIKLEYDSLDARAKRLELAVESELGVTIAGRSRTTIAPPPTQRTPGLPPGVWVLYPVKGKANAEFLSDTTGIKKLALVLNPDGTVRQIDPPKKKKKSK
jgi:hypothetical protein